VAKRVRQLEAEIAQLNRCLASTPAEDAERRIELMRAIRGLDRELAGLRYQQKTPEEREEYWVWVTNHQMRVQCEAGEDEYAIFNSEWLEATRAWEPRIERILLRVAAELNLDYDFVMRLAAAEAGSDAWKAIRGRQREA
jgi:hypothetical protein